MAGFNNTPVSIELGGAEIVAWVPGAKVAAVCGGAGLLALCPALLHLSIELVQCPTPWVGDSA